MAFGAIKLWVITEGIAGTENQCLGVASFLDAAPDIKKVTLRQPWKTLSPYLGFEMAESFIPSLAAPWPNLVVAGGRKAIAACRYIKAKSPQTKIVFLQDPRWPVPSLDLIAMPAHDSPPSPSSFPRKRESIRHHLRWGSMDSRFRGNDGKEKRVIITTATPNRITPKLLAEAKTKWTQFEKLSSPRAAILIGGSTKKYQITEDDILKLENDLKTISQKCALMVTASRRSGDRNIDRLRALVSSWPNTYFWDNTDENPYSGLLAYADYIFVTGDSLSMLSEAATTGTPVYRLLYGKAHKRLEKAHENLEKTGAVRLYKGIIDAPWVYAPLNDAQKVADEIKRRFFS